MSRVEENAKIRNDVSEAMEGVMKVADGLFGNERVELANSAKMTVCTTYLEDISKSLAVIADSMSYIVEDDKRRKEEQNKKTTPDYHHKNGTMKICGFCSKAEFTTMNCDEAIYHCPLHNTDVAFTCTACSDFDDIHHFDWIESKGWTKRMPSESMLPPDKKESEE